MMLRSGFELTEDLKSLVETFSLFDDVEGCEANVLDLLLDTKDMNALIHCPHGNLGKRI